MIHRESTGVRDYSDVCPQSIGHAGFGELH